MSTVVDRVRELLLQSGLTQHEFAARIGLDDSKLSKSFAGIRRFSSTDLAYVAERFEVTVDWLVTGQSTPIALAARTAGGSAAVAIAEAVRLSTIRSDIASLGFGQRWRPTVQSAHRGSAIERGRRLADRALRMVSDSGFSINVNSPLSRLVEEVFGVDVAIVELGPGFDGLAASAEDARLIVVATSHLPARQRFAIAHELGHLLAGDDQAFHVDKDIADEHQRGDAGEVCANAFATCFLMPESVLRDAVDGIGMDGVGFVNLACDLGVSPSALAHRLRSLDLLEAEASADFGSMTAAKAAAEAGRVRDYAELVAQAKSPRLPIQLVRDTYAAYDAGESTLRPFANLIGVDVDTLHDAMDVKLGVVDA